MVALRIMKKLTRPLTLSTETIRALSAPQLAAVAGAGPVRRSHGCTTLCLTFYTCPTNDCPKE
jgi:hypothetical protein